MAIPSQKMGKPYNVNIILKSDNILRNMFFNEEMKDFVIVAGNGEEVKCHGAVLAGQSDVFEKMVLPSTGMKESQTKRIEMKHLTEDGLNRLVRYLYGMRISCEELSCEEALELFQAAGLYNLDHLKTSLQKMFQERDAAWFGPNSALELYCSIKDQEDDSTKTLKMRVLGVMKGMLDSIRACDGFEKLDKSTVTDLLIQLLDISERERQQPVAPVVIPTRLRCSTCGSTDIYRIRRQ